MQDSLTLVIPAYNEESALAAHLPEVISFCEHNGHALIVVDDGSEDRTPEVLTQFGGHACLTVIRNKVRTGYGGAIKRGIAAARTEYVATIDADGQHSVDDVRNLHEEILATDADMIVGQRDMIEGESLYRKVGKTLIRLIAKILLPVHIRDLNSGMKIYNTNLVQKYSPLCPDTMAFSDIITLTFISQRRLVLERPINIRPRVHGVSTIGVMTALDTVREILNIVVLFNPMKLFFPIAALLFVSGVVWGVPIVLRGRGVSVGALLGVTSGLMFFFLGLIAEQLSLIRKSGIADD